MREREWLALSEALAWMMANATSDGGFLGPLSQNEAWRLLRGAVADDKVALRGARYERRDTNPAWDNSRDAGRIIPEIAEALWPVAGLDGSLWLANELKASTMNLLRLLVLDRFPAVFWTSVTVSRRDLEGIFAPRPTQVDRQRKTTNGTAPRKPVRPARESAQRAIAALYSGEVPDQALLRNQALCKHVRQWFSNQKLPSNFSDDTILRAAGRKV
jgi:hypothetical protein